MSVRTRFALAFALVSAVVAGCVGVLSYHAAAERITSANDTTLQAATVALAAGQTGVLSPVPSPTDDDHDADDPGGPDVHQQLQVLVGRRLAADGATTFLGGRAVALPVTDAARAVAAASAAGLTDTTETTVGRDTYRVLTTSLGGGAGALQVAMDVDLSRFVLQGMAEEVTGVSVVVLLVAAGAGWILAGRITRRLVRLAGLAERVSVRGLADEVPVQGRDEVARLSASFNTMTGRLAAAREAQDRLVQDAAHELRTPLTSLRTNASVLRRFDELPPAARERLIADVQGETRELSHLVDELVELALVGESADEPEGVVVLSELARRAAERVLRRTGREITLDDDGSVVRGRPAALERALTNLLENAAKFDPTDLPIEVAIRRGTTTVRDHGPGIAAADAERVFDRFYRSDDARGRPGSGLGLAIVRDVAERHGGGTTVATAPGGGAVVGFGVGPGRLLPDSDPGHDEASPRTPSLGGT